VQNYDWKIKREYYKHNVNAVTGETWLCAISLRMFMVLTCMLRFRPFLTAVSVKRAHVVHVDLQLSCSTRTFRCQVCPSSVNISQASSQQRWDSHAALSVNNCQQSIHWETD